MVWRSRRRFPVKRRYTAVSKRYIRSAGETKFRQFKLWDTFDSITNAWKELNLTYNEEGSGSYMHTGSKIMVTGVKINGVLLNSFSNGFPTLADYYNVVRMVIVVIRGYTPNPMANQGVLMDLAMQAENAPLVSQIVYDRYHCLSGNLIMNAADTIICGPNTKSINFTYRFKRPIIVSYAPPSTSSTQVILGMRSDSSAAPHPGFINGYAQLIYKDY